MASFLQHIFQLESSNEDDGNKYKNDFLLWKKFNEEKSYEVFIYREVLLMLLRLNLLHPDFFAFQ